MVLYEVLPKAKLLYADSVHLPTVVVATLLEVALDETLLLAELSTGACVASCFALLIAAATSLLALAGACVTVTVLELSALETSLVEDSVLEVDAFLVVFFFLLELVLDDEVVVLLSLDCCPRTVKPTITSATTITNVIIKFRFLCDFLKG